MVMFPITDAHAWFTVTVTEKGTPERATAGASVVDAVKQSRVSSNAHAPEHAMRSTMVRSAARGRRAGTDHAGILGSQYHPSDCR